MTRTVCGRMPHLRKPCALFALPMALCIALVCSVHAGEVRWTGGAGVGEDGLYDWTEPANWQGNALPQEGDVPVFAPSGSITLKTPSKSGVSYRFKGLKFLSGSTYIDHTGTYIHLRTSKTVEIYVADNAFASITNQIDTYTSEKVVLKKTGGGTFEARHIGTDGCFAEIDVQEGYLGGVKIDSWYGMRSLSFRIHDGARLLLPKADWLVNTTIDGVNRRPDMYIESGGALRIGGMARVCSLRGEGVVCGYAGNETDLSWNTITLYPTNDCVFSGVVRACVTVDSSSSGRLVLGNKDVLASSYYVTGSKFGFLPGVDEPFQMGYPGGAGSVWYSPVSGSALHLAATNGDPVTVRLQLKDNASAANLSTTGPGNLYIVNGATTFNGGNLRHTGILGNRASDQTMTLGDETAANDFDFSMLSGLHADRGPIVVRNSAPLVFNGRLFGENRIAFANDVTLGNVNFTGEGGLYAYGDVTITGGDSMGAFSAVIMYDDNATFTMAGGRIRRSEALDNTQISQIPVSDGVLLPNFEGTSVISGGDYYLSSYNGMISRNVELVGGRLILTAEQMPKSGSSAESPTVFRLDGGELVMRFFDSSRYLSAFQDSDALRVVVGEKGAVLRQCGLYNATYGHSVAIKRGIQSGVVSGVDGGWSQYGFAPVTYHYPMTITGPFRSVGGYSVVAATAVPPADAPFFGYGDLELENSVLQLAERTAAAANPIKVATASGAKLRYAGGSAIRMRGGYDSVGAVSGAVAQAVEVGAFERAAGGVLYLADGFGSRYVGASGCSTVKSVAAVPVHETNGRVLQPIVGVTGSSPYQLPYFLGYDAGTGFVKLEGIKTDLESSTVADVVEFTSPKDGWTGFSNSIVANALYVKQGTTIHLYEGAYLSIGDGTAPAMLLMNKCNITGTAGSGINFGTSEGVVVCGNANSASISARILTASGMTFTGFPDYRNGADSLKFTLSGENAYSGATRVGAIRLYAKNARCFSTGDVYVSDGERFGGQVRFSLDGGVWQNNFHVAGRGEALSIWGDRTQQGALFFELDGTIAGGVELTAKAEMCVSNAVVGTISGVVSGDALRVFDSPGVLRLTNSNTYTGGTEVVSATLAISCGDGAGTGPVLLDNGTLRFVNDVAVVFTNKVEGVGRIELCGTGSVRFEGESFASLPFSDLAPGAAFDYPSLDNAAWCVNVGDGGLDLGGRDVTLAGIAGSGRVSGGTVTVTGEINPGGVSTIGTLTFDRAPVMSGATLVAEAANGMADKLVVEGDVSLSGLALRVVGLDGPMGSGTATIFESTGTMSGAFSSVEKTPNRMNSREIEYGENSVRLQLGVGIIMIVL